MVEIIEIEEYFPRIEAIATIIVTSLEDLKKMADTFKEPFIFKKGEKEYIFFHDNVCYRYKK